MEYFKYFAIVITNSAKCTRALSPDYRGKRSIQQEDGSFHHKIAFKLKKETCKVLNWSVALYGAETRTLRKMDQKYLESL
jgi:hypothetical protein